MVEGKRCEEKQAVAMTAATAQPQRDVMDMHRALGHANERSRIETAKKSGIVLTGEWTPCEECSKTQSACPSISEDPLHQGDEEAGARVHRPRRTDGRGACGTALFFYGLCG